MNITATAGLLTERDTWSKFVRELNYIDSSLLIRTVQMDVRFWLCLGISTTVVFLVV